MPLDVVVLVSPGRHPITGRARRAERDAKAVELGMQLTGRQLTLLHAGAPEETALRAYLGMGIAELTVLRQAAGADIVPALVEYLAARRPDIILTGSQAESGEDSGLVPYLLAQRLDYPLLANMVRLELADGRPDETRARGWQALPRGQRRVLEAPLPLLATVDHAAPAARPSAYGPAQRGTITVIEAGHVPDSAAQQWNAQPARKRPKRLKLSSGGNAQQRVQAATQVQGGGQVLTGLTPAQAAQTLYDYLQAHGLLPKQRGA